jgi:hypothetical protein
LEFGAYGFPDQIPQHRCEPGRYLVDEPVGDGDGGESTPAALGAVPALRGYKHLLDAAHERVVHDPSSARAAQS